jgi:uncharacterized cupredoxin-like copper-binding protein
VSSSTTTAPRFRFGRVAPALHVNPRQTRTVTLTLKPGKYVLICNIADHYTVGQYSAFVVSG